MSLLGIPLADPRPPHLAPLLALAALAPCGPLLAQDNIRCRRQAVHACAAAMRRTPMAEPTYPPVVLAFTVPQSRIKTPGP